MENVNCPHHVLPAHRAFGQQAAALVAAAHVTALEEDTVDACVHANLADILLVHWKRKKWKERKKKRRSKKKIGMNSHNHQVTCAALQHIHIHIPVHIQYVRTHNNQPRVTICSWECTRNPTDQQLEQGTFHESMCVCLHHVRWMNGDQYKDTSTLTWIGIRRICRRTSCDEWTEREREIFALIGQKRMPPRSGLKKKKKRCVCNPVWCGNTSYFITSWVLTFYPQVNTVSYSLHYFVTTEASPIAWVLMGDGHRKPNHKRCIGQDFVWKRKWNIPKAKSNV